MARKEILERKKIRLEEKKEKLLKRSQESEDVNEVRAINEDLIDISNELNDIADELSDIANQDQEKQSSKEENPAEKENEENRSNFNPNETLNVVGSFKSAVSKKPVEDTRSSLEYRKAFMNYIQKGELNKNVLEFESRNNATGTAANLGVLIPTTVMQEIIKATSKQYGQLYQRVRHLNIKGGVKFPIGSFSATFHRITDGGSISDRQNAGGITGSIEFSYKIGEIRLARTLLETILSVDVFEKEFAEVCAEAYVKAMDAEILNGTDGNNQMIGILTEAAAANSRIPAANTITFTSNEMADWKSWQTKLFSKIPLSMRSAKPEFVMTANTYEANIKTLCDDNNRPVYNETFNPIDGAETATFKGKEVVFVEDDVFKNFNDATNGQYFGMYWVPSEAYAINSNLEFTVMDYFDQETNQWVKKAIVVNDGKVLKGNYIYLLQKSVVG